LAFFSTSVGERSSLAVGQFEKLSHLFSQTDYSVPGRGSDRMSLARLFKANALSLDAELGGAFGAP
jgi:hypothetical protein